MSKTWQDIWEARKLDGARGSKLASLMAADGLDTGYGDVTEAAWRGFVERTATRLGVEPGASVFEVGCGAGAFLHPLHERGCRVAGLDASATLIGYARDAMPEGRFTHAEALALDPAEKHDFVLSCGVFLYFPDLDYARAVVTSMVAAARRGVAILEIGDQAKEAHAAALRRGTMGEAEYEERYRGLDHLYLDKEWLRALLAELGAKDIRIEDQDIAGYANSSYRFNAFARV
jgi:2-polyprenyl-3-methyl-5-hydroxy-6-metoxy-1,4-benzoquinol methylase